MILRKIFSFPVLLAVLLVAGVFVSARLAPPDPDTWWHIAVGERILRTGSWPTSDPYSFTVFGSSWIAYEWLGEVLIAETARLGGLPGRTAMVIALAGIFLVLLYYYGYVRCGNVKAAFVACAVLLPVAGVFFTLRPQLLGYIFLLITLISLDRFRQGHSKALWILPPLFLLWVNSHGSFAFGLMILCLYWASGLVDFRRGGLVAERWTEAQRRQLLIVILLCVLVLPLTPYGTRLAVYPFELAAFQPVNVASIQEWQPLSAALAVGKVFLALLLVFFLAQVVLRPSYRAEHLALLLFAVYAAFVHVRFLFFFVLIAAPLLAELSARWIPGYQPAKDKYLLNIALIVLVGVGMVKFFPSQAVLEQKLSSNYPQGAVEYLRQHPVPGAMLNEYGWGGYLIWARGPEHKVFIDGRADIYEYGGVLSDYASIILLRPNALFVLRKYNVAACLLRHDARLSTVLGALPDWKRVYADDLSVLFVQRQVPKAEMSAVNGQTTAKRSKSLLVVGARHRTN